MRPYPCCVLALVFLLTRATLAHAETLRIGSWDRGSDPLTISSEAVLSAAYDELKQPVEFVDRPVRRAMIQLFVAELDGNLHRTVEFQDLHAGLARVATPINFMAIRIYSAKANVEPADWKQLSGLRVAYRRGVLAIERKLPVEARRFEAKSEEDALRMLATGIADVALAAEQAQSAPNPMAVEAKLRRLDAVLDATPLYHFLLARHRAVAERLDQVLKRMQNNGEMETIRRRALAPPGERRTVD